MTIASLLDRIIGRQRQLAKERADDYLELVKDIVAGRERDPSEIESILRENGKTTDSLKAEIDLRQKRIEMQASLRSLPGLKAEKKDVEAQAARANEALDAARHQHNKAIWPLSARLKQIENQMHEAERCREQLLMSCPNEELRAQLSDLQKNADSLRAKSIKLRDDIRDYQRNERDFGKAPSPGEEGMQFSDADRAKKLAACQEELPIVQKQLTDVEHQIQALREAMLQP